ncbi:hypothetical protein LXA43DRAFT_210161 [Ganoderma leucocontextum]|nr:hypothetical protein LXA43DRAFT_587387 [Ganoderma leucocontextum]KAI1784500.1 hypothetical protein LXA43DRAFT_210161 [Ganoderma leucocontextum]
MCHTPRRSQLEPPPACLLPIVLAHLPLAPRQSPQTAPSQTNTSGLRCTSFRRFVDLSVFPLQPESPKHHPKIRTPRPRRARMDLPPFIRFIDIPIDEFRIVPDSVFSGFTLDRNTPDPFEILVQRLCNYLDIPGMYSTEDLTQTYFTIPDLNTRSGLKKVKRRLQISNLSLTRSYLPQSGIVRAAYLILSGAAAHVRELP